jgi:hypothetical protein
MFALKMRGCILHDLAKAKFFLLAFSSKGTNASVATVSFSPAVIGLGISASVTSILYMPARNIMHSSGVFFVLEIDKVIAANDVLMNALMQDHFL